MALASDTERLIIHARNHAQVGHDERQRLPCLSNLIFPTAGIFCSGFTFELPRVKCDWNPALWRDCSMQVGTMPAQAHGSRLVVTGVVTINAPHSRPTGLVQAVEGVSRLDGGYVPVDKLLMTSFLARCQSPLIWLNASSLTVGTYHSCLS